MMDKQFVIVFWKCVSGRIWQS